MNRSRLKRAIRLSIAVTFVCLGVACIFPIVNGDGNLARRAHELALVIFGVGIPSDLTHLSQVGAYVGIICAVLAGCSALSAIVLSMLCWLSID